MDGCGEEGCAELKHGLVNLFGMEWRKAIFGGASLRQFDIGEMEELCLLLGLGNSDSFQFILLRLLGKRSKEAMLAHWFVCAWLQNKEQKFPGEEHAKCILTCASLVTANLRSCSGTMELLHLSSGIISLLNLRLGCRLAESVCCTAVCWLGASCASLTQPPESWILCDSRSSWVAGAGAGSSWVLVGKTAALEVKLFSAVAALNEKLETLWVSAEAAQLCPMELGALRAGVLHRSFRWLSPKWLCPVTALVRVQRLRAQAKLPDFTAASFRDAEAAEE